MKRYRSRKYKANKHQPKRSLLCIRAALASCVINVLLILVFALLLKEHILEESAVSLANTCIKLVCSGFAGFLAEKYYENNKSWLFSGISGVIYIVVSYIAFSVVQNTFSFKPAFFLDILLAFVCGAAAAILKKFVFHKPDKKANC